MNEQIIIKSFLIADSKQEKNRLKKEAAQLILKNVLKCIGNKTE